jgi:hypothetical protein
MAQGSTQALIEISTRNLPGSKGLPTGRTHNLTAIYVPTVQKMWEPRRLTTLWASKACYRDIFTMLLWEREGSETIVGMLTWHNFI